MSRIAALLVILVVGTHTSLSAQACPPAPLSTMRDGSPAPWFDFQVDVPARLIGDSTRIPRPDVAIRISRGDTNSALVQFVVDTLGVPLVTSLKLLIMPTALTKGVVDAAIISWRYTPAMLRGCRVSQLVQTPLRWK